MNAHVSLTPTQASLIAAHRGVESRLGLLQPVSTRKPVFVHVRPDADCHVRAYGWWQELHRPGLGACDYIKLRCKLSGIDHALLRGPCRRHDVLDLRRTLVHELVEKYPHLSSVQIGRLMNRHHTSILSLLGRIKATRRRTVK